ncbi:hypothetical protein FB451DRAFT_1556610 [Mycena latifolia]|nr:hypothetical protein FB451DRAFT_1556610 [Mycena latifolia]
MTTKSARATRMRITELDVQIGALQLVLQALINERSSCQALLDDYKYPVLSLPHEITSEIFTKFLPPRPYPVGPLSPSFLCRICKTWRDIALSTPSLWSAIHLNLDEGDRHPQQLRVLQTWLERSKNCLLSVALEREEEHELDTTAFVKAIVLHSVRWADMTIVLPLEELRLIQEDMPRLQQLTYGPHDLVANFLVAEPVVTFDRAPNLTNVVLSTCFNPFVIVLPWSQLTALEGCLFDNEIVHVLRQTTSLERCSLLLHVSIRLTEPTTVPPLLHLTRLSISLHGVGIYTSVRLFDALTLPVLQLLQLDEHVLRGDLEPSMPALVSFMSRTRRLGELRITHSSKSEGFYRALFQDSVPKIGVQEWGETVDDDVSW